LGWASPFLPLGCECGKKAWDAIKQLKSGLQKTVVSSEVPWKRKSGGVCIGAKENAEKFGEHYEKLYMRTEGFDESAIDCIPQHEVDEDGGRVPGEKEVLQAIRRLNVSYPGCSGVSAATVKAVAEDEGARAVMVQVVGKFWETETVPAGWEDGLLRILPKSGDLSKPGNYRVLFRSNLVLKKLRCLCLCTNLLPNVMIS